jgi:hypothetical protein
MLKGFPSFEFASSILHHSVYRSRLKGLFRPRWESLSLCTPRCSVELDVGGSEFQGSRVTSDGGLVLVRELDERLGFSELIEQHLTDSRGKNTQLPLADLLRQSVYSRLAGYEDVNDAERLSQDPTLRLIGSEKIWERGAALTSRLQSF